MVTYPMIIRFGPCTSCMHVLPDLAAIESKYDSQPVTVVGVHSAKFSNEKDSDAIRSAVLRYALRLIKLLQTTRLLYSRMRCLLTSSASRRLTCLCL